MMTLLQLFVQYYMPHYNFKDGKFCQKLAQIGVRTIIDLMTKGDPLTLLHTSGVSNEDFFKVKSFIFKKHNKPPISLSEEIFNRNKSKSILSTGCKPLDALLPHGGVCSGYVTQVSGFESTGKSQICYNLTVEALKLNKNVFYIDTQAAFCSRRLSCLLNKNNMDENLLRFVKVAKISDFNDALDLLQSVLADNQYSLLIFDSLAGIFEAKLVQMQSLDRKKDAFDLLFEFTKILAAIRIKHPDLIIIVTNYKDKWIKKIWRIAYSFEINLSISQDRNFRIVHTAEIRSRDQLKKEYKSIDFFITDSGLQAVSLDENKLPPLQLTETCSQLIISSSKESELPLAPLPRAEVIGITVQEFDEEQQESESIIDYKEIDVTPLADESKLLDQIGYEQMSREDEESLMLC